MGRGGLILEDESDDFQELELDDDYRPLDFDNNSKFDRAEEKSLEETLLDFIEDMEEREERANVSLDDVEDEVNSITDDSRGDDGE